MTGELPRQQDPAEGDRATIERELERAEKRKNQGDVPKDKQKAEQREAEHKRGARP